eukprot:TRINITY_DN2130_c0_g1_i1.p1 TRINITY_DN2130_c0_g1~~TRINITY_DN2130_c0_g1_i1.p1  ORF type:complete len:385 (+),score=168.69 TRINITY_DN2130_c0_g1_i1:67-1221(+)
MAKAVVHTADAPAAIGPYCQAVRYGGMVYASGCIGLHPQTMQLADGLEAQTDQALRNLKAVLTAAGSGLEWVVKATVFVADMGDFARCNAVFTKYFGNHKPARSCVAAKALPKNCLFELNAVATLKTTFAILDTPAAPAAIGPYCQGTVAGNTLYSAGCIGLDPKTMTLVPGLEAQTEQALRNLKAVLGAGGCAMADVVRATVFLNDMADFAKVNALYDAHFDGHKPARVCLAAQTLPKNALFEIEVIAARPFGGARRVVATPKAPAAIGPYSQGVVYGDLVYASGNIGMDLKCNLVEGLEAQTDLALRNLREVLEAAGVGMRDVLTVTVYLQDMADYAAVNDIFARHFAEGKPARTAIAAKGLPKGALFEIDAVAQLPRGSKL